MNNQKDIMQVFGCLMKQPSLLSQTDKYKFYVDDFSSRFERKVFSSILYLWQHGAESISEVDIVNYFSNIQSEYDYFEEQNGLEYITDCIELSDILSFDYYYERVKKFSLLSQLRKIGYNTDKIYNENNLSENSEEINKDFEQKTIKEIVDELNNELIKISEKCLSEDSNKTSDAAKGAQELIDGLKGAPDTGARLQGKFFNTIVRGARRGKFYIRSASSGVGKALPNYTKIPTPDGWKTVGQIKVGDYLFDREGKPTRVLGVYPQPEKKQIYEVKFRSGRVAECCGEHLWSYYNNFNYKNPDKLFTATVTEILNDPRGLRGKDGAYRLSVPINKPVQFPKKDYSIDPYVMGLILGDGSFRYNEQQKAFCFSSQDEELVQQIQERMGYKLYKRGSYKNYNWLFELTEATHKNVWVEDILADYSELWQAKSEDKYIPQEYLLGSIEQRYDLLAGLLDTDGSIDNKGRVKYTTISPYLRDNCIELCESLGMTCSVREDIRNKYSTGVVYNIHIMASKEQKLLMFKLERKKNKAIAYSENKKRTERRDRDSIIDIYLTDKYAEMTCFLVDNPEHLFLMNNFICTHNTRNTIGDACYLSYPICWNNEQNKWDFTGATEKVLIIVTEQEKDEVQTMIISYLSGVNEEKILYGSYNDEESDRIQKALWIMDKYNNLYITEMPNPNVQQIKFVVKEMCRRYDIGYVFYDYLFSNPSLLNEYRDLKIREDQALGIFSAELKALAVETNTFILTSTQTNAKVEDDGKEIKNESVIRGQIGPVNILSASSAGLIF